MLHPCLGLHEKDRGFFISFLSYTYLNVDWQKGVFVGCRHVDKLSDATHPVVDALILQRANKQCVSMMRLLQSLYLQAGARGPF